MKIRRMNLQDYSKVYHLWLHTSGMGLNTTDDSEAGIDKYLRRNPNTCFVAEKKEEIIGAILSGHDGRRGLIYHLAVKDSERKQGIGSALLDRAMEALQEEGIKKVYIMIFKNNEAGNAFWEKRGFTVPEDVLYRAKEIAPLSHMIIR